MSMKTEEIIQMIEDIEKRPSKLSEWEINFIDSISNQLAERGLSPKQYERLEAVWERVT